MSCCPGEGLAEPELGGKEQPSPRRPGVHRAWGRTHRQVTVPALCNPVLNRNGKVLLDQGSVFKPHALERCW